MEKTISFIECGLNILGLSIFKKLNESHIRKVLCLVFVLINGLFYFVGVWHIANPKTNVGDRLFLFSLIIGCTSSVTQFLKILYRRESFMKLFEWIKKLHSNRRGRDRIVETYCDGVYRKLGKYFWTLTK